MARRRMAHGLGLTLLAVLASLGGCSGPGPRSEGETHWLLACTTDADCGALACLCGVCTTACDAGTACAAVGTGAVCLPMADAVASGVCPVAAPVAGVCVAPGSGPVGDVGPDGTTNGVDVAASDTGSDAAGGLDIRSGDVVPDTLTPADTPPADVPGASDGPGPDADSGTSFATGAPEALAVCAAQYDGFGTCCSYQAEPETWVFDDAPCPGATDCSADTDCPPGYAETAEAERWCSCYYATGSGACDEDGMCPPESVIAGSNVRRCACEPLAAGVCEALDITWDSDLGCGGGLPPYGCAQALPPGYPKSTADLTEFCTYCACPAVDFPLPLHTAQESLAKSLVSCLAQKSGACCTWDAEQQLLVVSNSTCPGFTDCDLQHECPGGYTEAIGAADECLCQPNAAGVCTADPPIAAEVAAGERCPPPPEGAVMYRCPTTMPDTGAAFCSLCPCPLVDRPVQFTEPPSP